MKIALGSDHGGYALKCDIIQLLEKLGHEYKDFGCYSTESCDYPDFGEAAARAVASMIGASSSAPPASASPLPPTRCRVSAAPTVPTPWRRR